MDERNRAEYEAVYGRGTWAKVPVCEQQGAADEARAAKKQKRIATRSTDAIGPSLFDEDVQEEIEAAQLSEDEAEGEAFEEVEDTTEDALNDLDTLDMDGAGDLCDD